MDNILANDSDESSQRLPWQLLEEVTIYLENSVLEHGLVMCDHPGFGDQDVTRNDRARSGLASSTAICIVESAARVNDDTVHRKEMESVLKTAIDYGIPGGILLCVTGLDDFNPKNYARQKKLAGAINVKDLVVGRRDQTNPSMQHIVRHRADYIKTQQIAHVERIVKSYYEELRQADQQTNHDEEICDGNVQSNVCVVSAKAYFELEGMKDSPGAIIQTLDETGIPALQTYVCQLALNKHLHLLTSARTKIESAILSIVGALKEPTKIDMVSASIVEEQEVLREHLVSFTRKILVETDKCYIKSIVIFRELFKNGDSIYQKVMHAAELKMRRYEKDHKAFNATSDALHRKEFARGCRSEGVFRIKRNK